MPLRPVVIVLKIQDNSFILLVFLAKNSLNSTAAFMYSRNANTICKKCSTILAVIMSFYGGKEGGSKIRWSR
jgi:hypothetical protein